MTFLGALNSSLSFLAFYRLYRTLITLHLARKKSLTSTKGKGKEGVREDQQAAVKAQVERSEDRLAFLTLGVANGSQAVVDLLSCKLFEGRWR